MENKLDKISREIYIVFLPAFTGEYTPEKKESYRMRKSSAFTIAILMLVAVIGQLTAQGYVPGQTSEAYAYSHGGYVARATVKVLNNGSLDVEIDEAFLPHILAIVKYPSAEWTADNTVYYLSRGSEVRLAKYIEYGGKVYVGTTVGGAATYVEADAGGKAAGGQDLELLIIRNQDTMAAYYKNIQSGSFKVLAGFGGKATPVTETSYGGVTKASAPKYWNTGQTWQGNIDAIEAFIEKNGANFPHSEMRRATTADAKGLMFWSVADVVTGATNSDFKDYFGVAQAAISRLKMK